MRYRWGAVAATAGALLVTPEIISTRFSWLLLSVAH